MLHKFQRNFSISPPFLQAEAKMEYLRLQAEAKMEYLREVASKFNFKIARYRKGYFLEDVNDFEKSFFELMTFEDLYLLLTTLAESKNI